MTFDFFLMIVKKEEGTSDEPIVSTSLTRIPLSDWVLYSVKNFRKTLWL